MRRALAITGAAALLGAAACGSGKASARPLSSGEIGTWAGTGTQGNNGSGEAREAAWLDEPMELAFLPDGSALIADWNNHQIRKVGLDGTISTLIGTIAPGDWPCQEPGVAGRCDVPLTGEVPGATLNLNHPTDVAVTDDGSFYIAAWHNHKVEYYDGASTDVTVVAGMQKPGALATEGAPAQSALMNFPSSMVLQKDGSLLVSDEKLSRIRRIAADGDRAMTTVAGAAPNAGTDADGIAATTAVLVLSPTTVPEGAANPPPGGALALDGDGDLLISDTFHHCVRKVVAGADGIVTGATDELISTVAGTCGTAGYTGDGGPATAALLNQPGDIERSPLDGSLYVADTDNEVVRRIDAASGTIDTFAGTGKPGFSGDGGPAKSAQLREPYGLAFDEAGDLYVVDTMNHRIRRIAH